jgi:hypothetical protein
MEGPKEVLVDILSATHVRPWENQAHHVHGINRDHSGLVKFEAHDEVYDRVRVSLEEFVDGAVKMNRDIEQKIPCGRRLGGQGDNRPGTSNVVYSGAVSSIGSGSIFQGNGNIGSITRW